MREAPHLTCAVDPGCRGAAGSAWGGSEAPGHLFREAPGHLHGAVSFSSKRGAKKEMPRACDMAGPRV